MLLLGVRSGDCGSNSAWLFAQIVQQAQQRNSRISAADTEGLLVQIGCR
jgi:hypothetical protein